MTPRTPSPPFHTFAAFWNYYVSEHQHPVNQALHVFGTIGGIVCIAMTIGVSRWWGLAILPVGYGAAWLGHALIERNRPTTLKYPFWSWCADHRMMLSLLLGRPLRRNPEAQRSKDRLAA